MEAERFPERWKVAKLTLIQKPERPPDSPSAFRPICLLDEAGKLFKRIVANRLAEHLAQEGPDLSENQYGFQRERSTIDAIESVKSNAQAALRQGGKVLAVSIDIVNAFNSIPWDRIRKALIKHWVPTDLRNTPQGSDSFCWKTWGVTTPRTRVGPTQVGVSRHSNRGAKGPIPAAKRIPVRRCSLVPRGLTYVSPREVRLPASTVGLDSWG